MRLLSMVRSDKLEGMKENVICGHLIPAGTGQREFEKLSLDQKKSMIVSWRTRRQYLITMK